MGLIVCLFLFFLFVLLVNGAEKFYLRFKSLAVDLGWRPMTTILTWVTDWGFRGRVIRTVIRDELMNQDPFIDLQDFHRQINERLTGLQFLMGYAPAPVSAVDTYTRSWLSHHDYLDRWQDDDSRRIWPLVQAVVKRLREVDGKHRLKLQYSYDELRKAFDVTLREVLGDKSSSLICN